MAGHHTNQRQGAGGDRTAARETEVRLRADLPQGRLADQDLLIPRVADPSSVPQLPVAKHERAGQPVTVECVRGHQQDVRQAGH